MVFAIKRPHPDPPLSKEREKLKKPLFSQGLFLKLLKVNLFQFYFSSSFFDLLLHVFSFFFLGAVLQG
jgi:hypothetical protein